MNKNSIFAVIATTLALGATNVYSAVSSEQAQSLKNELTPVGAEKSGNADGTIPEWTGGITEKLPGNHMGDVPTELFEDEKPLYKVTRENMTEYEDLLSEGVKALLKKYPDTFYLNVYPTHRTGAHPQSIYENALANATRCETTEGGYSIEGCAGGTPFPIPQSGVEVMWNFLMRTEAPSIEYTFKNIVGNSDGSHTLATQNEIAFQYPQFYEGVTPESWSGEYAMFRFNTLAPPFKAGESLVIRDSVDSDQPRQAWQYLLGQRRVRQAPTVSYDTPDFVASGANYFDEVQGFFGALDRFDWKLVGKKEMLIPYNNNGFIGASIDDAYMDYHANPEEVRWELHRVWEVEATVRDGKRHAVPKRTYFLDEDTWLIALVDGYDSEGNLWRASMTTPFVVPEIPATLLKTTMVFNLQANSMSIIQAMQGEYLEVVPTKPETYFTGDAVAAEAMR
ncbi:MULTISPECIES: DUF1329 domain-containing protein [Marinobacter]|uniref:DUF1329 domain-containing protein n=1 Tax=Marinobacter TaxID=2742 RepID=UPI00124857D9|nr:MULTISPECIES: DUF1329 domain-containing protein [Marinobacter]MBL3556350.1 DUF1329 domain-containing protein [Marinobacter sp. JB05H06]